MSYYNDFYDMITPGRQGTPGYTPAGQFQAQPMMPYNGQQATPFAAQPMPSFPTGAPTGPSASPLMPSPAPEVIEEPTVPTTLDSTLFTPGYLRTQIGKRMRVEFLIGTNGPMVDRTGTLVGVGTSYILLQPIETDDVMLCDIYSIKFVTILL